MKLVMKKKEEKENVAYDIPNALESLDLILPNIEEEKNKLLLFLDYDGTLSEIVNDPDKAILTQTMSDLLLKLSSLDNILMVIVTGRSIEKVRSFMPKNDNIHFAGNHGIEIEFASNSKMDKKLFVDEESVKALNLAHNALKDEYKVIEKYNGTQIEYKTYSLSVHYRNMKVENEQKAMSEIGEIMKDLSKKHNIHLSEGKKLFELKCVDDWNKGYAMKWMLENKEKIFGLEQNGKRNNVIFIGDDVTDEDRFGALLDYGENEEMKDNVSTILVTHNKVRQTKAAYYVNTVSDVETLLGKIGDALQ